MKVFFSLSLSLEISKLITCSFSHSLCLSSLSELKQIVLFISAVSDLRDCSTDSLVRAPGDIKTSKARSIFIASIFSLAFQSRALLCLQDNNPLAHVDNLRAGLRLYGMNVREWLVSSGHGWHELPWESRNTKQQNQISTCLFNIVRQNKHTTMQLIKVQSPMNHSAYFSPEARHCVIFFPHSQWWKSRSRAKTWLFP